MRPLVSASGARCCAAGEARNSAVEGVEVPAGTRVTRETVLGVRRQRVQVTGQPLVGQPLLFLAGAVRNPTFQQVFGSSLYLTDRLYSLATYHTCNKRRQQKAQPQALQHATTHGLRRTGPCNSRSRVYRPMQLPSLHPIPVPDLSPAVSTPTRHHTTIRTG